MLLWLLGCFRSDVGPGIVDSSTPLEGVGPQQDPGDCANVEQAFLVAAPEGHEVLAVATGPAGTRVLTYGEPTGRRAVVVEIDSDGAATELFSLEGTGYVGLGLQGFTRDGGAVWAGRFGGSLSLPGTPGETLTAPSGQLAAGLVRLSPAGDVVWARQLADDARVVTDAVVLADDSVLVAYQQTLPPSKGEVFERLQAVLTRVQPDGTEGWSSPIEGTLDLDLHAMAHDPAAGVVTVVGRASGEGVLQLGDGVSMDPAGGDGWIAQFQDDDGRARWVTVVSGVFADVQTVAAVPGGGVVAGGIFTGAVSLARDRASAVSLLESNMVSAAWVAQLDHRGELEWAERTSRQPSGVGFGARTVAVVRHGDEVLWLGSGEGQLGLGEPPHVSWPLLDEQAVFLARVGLDGSWRCATRWMFFVNPDRGRLWPTHLRPLADGTVSLSGHGTGRFTIAPNRPHRQIVDVDSETHADVWEVRLDLP